MGKEIQLFENSEFGQVTAIEKDGEPWFVAKEIAGKLGYKDTATTIRNHCKYVELLKNDDSSFLEIPPRGLQIINEKDVYRLIMRSDLSSAERFQDWIMDEVLPSIRKRGMYATPMTTEEMIEDPERAIRLLQELKQEQEKRRSEQKKRELAETQCNALEDRIGEGENWKQVKAIPWVKDVFTVSRGMWMAVGKRLKNISIDMGFDVKSVPDSEFGAINRYHVDVIEEFRIRLSRDLNMLWKYRV